MKNGILLLSAFVLMLSTITAQVGGAAGGGATPTTQGGTPSQKPATGSDSKTTDKKMVGGSGPSTDKKAIGTGPKCCGRLLINRPGTTAASQATVLAESLLDLTFDMLDPNNKPVDKKLWKVAENTAGELVLDASKAPVLAKGKFYMLRVKYGAKYMDYKL